MHLAVILALRHCDQSPAAVYQSDCLRLAPCVATGRSFRKVTMSFSSLGLSDAIVRAVTEAGYTTPTPIQMQAIPAVMNGGDLLAGAQTGTGKTAGFTLPILHRLSTDASGAAQTGNTSQRPIRALILTPTRELAAQVEESVRIYGKYTKLNSTVIFGGVGINPQIKQLKHGVDILVATPGRLLDHMEQRTVDLSKVEILILDEADRMPDMGFIRDIKKVLAVLPKQRQNLLFSATFSEEIKALADGLLNKPAMIEVARRNSTVEVIAQKIHPVDRDKKHPMLSYLIKTNKLQVLVATDIAARGIDIDQLPHVVNYDLPNIPEDYVHRIGRTGRAGATGEAVSLVCVDEHEMLKDIEKLIKQTLPREVIAGFEPDPTARAQPVQLRSGAPGHRGGGRSGGGGGGQVIRVKTGGGNGGGSKPRSAGPGGPAGGGGGGARSGAPRSAAQHRSGGRGR